MDSHSCEECKAIYRELRDATEEARKNQDHNATPHQLAEWLQQPNEEDCARMRLTSSLWKTWRRMMEHRTLTGHSVSVLALPPNAMANPN
jgi:hypothetical protein